MSLKLSVVKTPDSVYKLPSSELKSPQTLSLYVPGFAVPIPTLPSVSMVTCLVLFVSK